MCRRGRRVVSDSLPAFFSLWGRIPDPSLAGGKIICTAEDCIVNILLWPAYIINLDALWEIKNKKQNKTPTHKKLEKQIKMNKSTKKPH